MINQSKFEVGIGYVEPSKNLDSYFPMFFAGSFKGKVAIIGHKDDLPIVCLVHKDKNGEYILVNDGKVKIHSKNKKFSV